MSFFTDPEITMGVKCLEIVFILMGLIAIYSGVRNLMDKENPARYGTALFWTALGIVLALGRWIPPLWVGVLIVIMTLPAIFKQVKPGKEKPIDPEESAAMEKKLGMKIFIPAFSMGVFAILFAVFTKLGALVGIAVGVMVSIVILMIMNPKNKPVVFLDDSKRLLGMVGPLSMLPMLLASLGAIFTAAGVGDVIASMMSNVVPKNNITVGIIVYAVGMMLFTMIMGNAFAAITVMTVGIGGPFVLALGANPVVIGMLGLTCGYCGTLLTPMAANFNIVPVAMLEMKNKYGVIKNQVVMAFVLLVFQIGIMLAFH